MSTTEFDKYKKCETLLNAMHNSALQENPIQRFKHILDAINPSMVQSAVEKATEQVEDFQNSEDGKICHIGIGIGGSNASRDFYVGIVSALVWFKHFVDSSDVSSDDKESLENIYRLLNIPEIEDYHKKNLKAYLSFMLAVGAWTTEQNFDIGLTNGQCCSSMVDSALSGRPIIPSAFYYIGDIKTDNPRKALEQINESINFRKDCSESALDFINPRITLVSKGSPFIPGVSHELTNYSMATEYNNKVTWMSSHIRTQGFKDLLTEKGISFEDFELYEMQFTNDYHESVLKNKSHKFHKLATIIEADPFLLSAMKLQNKVK